MTRRVDRVEFIDLMTVRRTIALTFDLERLGGMLSRSFLRPAAGEQLVPLGWFVPWANAGAVLLDADGRVIPYLTHGESDRRVRELIVERLHELGNVEELKTVLGEVSELEDTLDVVLAASRRSRASRGCLHVLQSGGRGSRLSRADQRQVGLSRGRRAA